MRKTLACLLLLASACGGNVSIDDLTSAIIDGECAYLVKCKQYPSQDLCARTLGLDPGRDVAGAKAGRIQYDGGKASDCIDGIRNAGCRSDDIRAALANPACQQTLTGLVPVNGACFESDDCVDHGGCTFPAGCNRSTMCCAGTCGAAQPFNVPVGQACTSTSVCVSSAYCGAPAPTRVCKDHITAENAACDAGDACALPLRCLADPTPATTMSCRVPAATGDPCDPAIAQSCAQAYDTCNATSRTCTTLPDVGQPCTGTGTCLNESRCLNNTCASRGDVNAACGAGTAGCAGSLACTNNICSQPMLQLACP